jgi:hypothetical protein
MHDQKVVDKNIVLTVLSSRFVLDEYFFHTLVLAVFENHLLLDFEILFWEDANFGTKLFLFL